MTEITQNQRPARGLNLGGLSRLLGPDGGRFVPMIVVFVLLVLAFNIASDGIFLTPRNITLLLRQGAIISIVAMGVSILIVKGEIDLSIGSAVYLCSVVAAMLQLHYGWAVVPTVLATMAMGILLGIWQGVWTVAVGVPSFVVTLAGLLAFRGVGYYATDAATLAPMSESYTALSEGFLSPGATWAVMLGIFAAGTLNFVWGYVRDRQETGRGDFVALVLRIVILGACVAAGLWVFLGYRGIPAALISVGVCGIVLWFLMMRTEFGRNAYLIGSNREAARLAGISIRNHLIGGFILMGALYGIAGTLLTARLSASTPTGGLYMELDAIAAAVIGGTSLRGGIGTVGGAIAGAILLVTIDNGMSILNVSSFLQMVVKGLVLLAALAVDSYLGKSRVK